MKFLIVLLLVVFFPLVSFAETICGDTVPGAAAPDFTSLCSSPDEDRDGWAASVDCDDTDRTVYPGAWKAFILASPPCGAMELAQCQPDGTWGTCHNLTNLPANIVPGGLNLFWIDAVGSGTPDGSFADPYRWDFFSNPGYAHYRSPQPGDVFIMTADDISGTWNDSGTIRQFYVNNKDGTPTNPIYVLNPLGATILGQGSSPTELPVYQIQESDYWTHFGINVSGGYATAGIYLLGGTGHVLYGAIVDSIGGNQNNNLAGIKVVDTIDFEGFNLISYNNFEALNPTGVNNAQIYVTGSDSFSVYNSIAFVTGSAKTHCFKNKHRYLASENSGSSFSYNVGINCLHSGVQWVDAQMTVYNNYFKNIGGTAGPGGIMAISNVQDGNGYFHNSEVYNNTIDGGPFVIFNPNVGTLTSPALNLHDNVAVDDATGYQPDGENGFFRVCRYCDNTTCPTIVSGGGLETNDNCYFNTASTPFLFVLYPDACGANYTGLASWQSGGWDLNSFNEDPAIDSDGQATSVNCAGKGFLLGSGAPTPTPTPTPTPVSIGNAYLPIYGS